MSSYDLWISRMVVETWSCKQTKHHGKMISRVHVQQMMIASTVKSWLGLLRTGYSCKFPSASPLKILTLSAMSNQPIIRCSRNRRVNRTHVEQSLSGRTYITPHFRYFMENLHNQAIGTAHEVVIIWPGTIICSLIPRQKSIIFSFWVTWSTSCDNSTRLKHLLHPFTLSGGHPGGSWNFHLDAVPA